MYFKFQLKPHFYKEAFLRHSNFFLFLFVFFYMDSYVAYVIFFIVIFDLYDSILF